MIPTCNACDVQLVNSTTPYPVHKVEGLTIKPERPLVVMSMTRPRRSFGCPAKLVDRDASEWLTDDYMAKVGGKSLRARERGKS